MCECPPAPGPHMFVWDCDGPRCLFACEPGWGDCDSDSVNGCETDLTSDVWSCGGCGAACSAGETCEGSACRCDPTTCGAAACGYSSCGAPCSVSCDPLLAGCSMGVCAGACGGSPCRDAVSGQEICEGSAGYRVCPTDPMRVQLCSCSGGGSDAWICGPPGARCVPRP